MSSFSGLAFRVKPDSDGFYPLPARDTDGIPYLSLEARFSTYSIYQGMQNKVARGTPKVPSGTNAVNWHSDAGGSSGTLTVATYRGETETYTAVLVEFSPAGFGKGGPNQDPYFKADMRFIILSDLTP